MVEPDNLTRASFDKLSQKGLFELYEGIFGAVGTVNVLQKTSELIGEALDAERATIYIVARETQELKSVAFIGNVAQSIIIPITSESLAGYCARSKKSFVVHDAYGDLEYLDPKIKFDRSWDEMNDFRTRDVICIPATFKGEVMGVVQAINSRGEPFNESSIPPLENISRFIAYALYHAQLYDEIATLKGLEREKAEFIRILVHELKSPLATSKILVSSMLYKSKRDPEISNALAKIGIRLDQLLLLVEDVLHLSRIKSGIPLGEISVFNLVSGTSHTFKRYMDEAESKGLKIKLNLPDSPVLVRIDKKGFQLILSNLISNAIKYTFAGSVTVSLGQNNEWAVLKVKDTGIGIPGNEITSLFKEFFRATNARKTQIIGTGVGLAGVKELVTRFGGILELNTKENKGSEFTVRFPIHRKPDGPD
jgi:signal transduction histidine kinase